MRQVPAAVTFDFWNTLAHEPRGLLARLRLDATRHALAALGLEVTDARVQDEIAAVGLLHQTAWTTGRPFPPELAAQEIAHALAPQLTSKERSQLAAAFLEAPATAELELAPGVVACLHHLRSAGIRTGIVCDVGLMGSRLLREFLAREGVLDLFDAWAFSDEVGHYKPSPEIFQAALDALRIDTPADAVHIGDLRRTDVAGAFGIGMRSIRYRGIVDDPDPGPEADDIVDHHRDLPTLLALDG